MSITHSYCYQCLFLEMRNSTVKYKNWFNPVIQQFTDTIEQANQVCIGNWVSMLVTHSLYRLIQQQTGIWLTSRLSNLNSGIDVYLRFLWLSVNQYPQSTVHQHVERHSTDSQSIVGLVLTNSFMHQSTLDVSAKISCLSIESWLRCRSSVYQVLIEISTECWSTHQLSVDQEFDWVSIRGINWHSTLDAFTTDDLTHPLTTSALHIFPTRGY